MGNGEWGMGSGKWGVGSGEWGQGDVEKWKCRYKEAGILRLLVPTPHSPLPIPHSPFPLSSSQAIFGHTKIRVAFFVQSNLKRDFEAGL